MKEPVNEYYILTDPAVERQFLENEGNPPKGEWRYSCGNSYIMEWWGEERLKAESTQQNASVSHKKATRRL